MRVDDSVVKSFNQNPSQSARSRGYAPDPISLPVHNLPYWQWGAELKNVFCLTRDGMHSSVITLVDMENYETFLPSRKAFPPQTFISDSPERIACDLHPDYLATKYAIQQSGNQPPFD